MTTRTFKQMGCGFGNTESPVTVVVTLDDQEIYNGVVPTEPVVDPDSVSADEYHKELFSWTMPVNMSDIETHNINITVNNGILRLHNTNCTYSVNDYNAEEDFGYCCIVDVGGTQFLETFSNVVINNIPQQRVWEVVNTGGPNNGTGQWHWTVPDQATFGATITVQVPTHYTA
jgi:hypothetical protein